MKLFQIFSSHNIRTRIDYAIKHYTLAIVFIILLACWLIFLVFDSGYMGEDIISAISFVLISSVISSITIGLVSSRTLIPSLMIVLWHALSIIVWIIWSVLVDYDIFQTMPYTSLVVFGLIGGLLSIPIIFATTYKLDGHQQWNWYWIAGVRLFLVGVCWQIVQNAILLALIATNILFQLNSLFDSRIITAWIIVCSAVFGIVYITVLPNQAEYLKKDLYPKFLKVFVAWISLPLLMIYLLILTIWSVVSLISWNWGGFSVVSISLGMLIPSIAAVVLLIPRRTESKTLGIIFKLANCGILLTMISYAIAIGIRISDYGITPSRYLIVAIGVLFTMFGIYNLVYTKNKLSHYAYMFLIVAAISFVSPFNLLIATQQSQLPRYTEVFERNGLEISNQTYEYEWSNEDSNILYSIIYLNVLTQDIANLHGYDEQINVNTLQTNINVKYIPYARENTEELQKSTMFSYDNFVVEGYKTYVTSLIIYDGDFKMSFNNLDSIGVRTLSIRDNEIFFDDKNVLTYDQIKRYIQDSCSEIYSDNYECSSPYLEVQYTDTNGNIYELSFIPTFMTTENDKIQTFHFDLLIG